MNFVRTFEVIKDIKSQFFKASYIAGDKLYLQDELNGSIFDSAGNFVCALGSPLQTEYMRKISSEGSGEDTDDTCIKGEAAKSDNCVLRCNACNSALMWVVQTPHNLALPEEERECVASSDYIPGYTTCRSCVVEYCINTNCLGCDKIVSETGSYKDCKFYKYIKEK